MPIPLIAEIVPKNNGAFALVDDNNIRGGYRVVNTILDRNSIPSDKLKVGMKCRVQADGKTYVLDNDLITWSEDIVSANNNTVEVSFSWGDVSPELIYEVVTDITISEVYLSIDTRFDGVGAFLKIGDETISNSLMDTFENDVTTEVIYSTEPMKELITGQKVYITFNPGSGATQGNGRIKLTW
jgi:hypothetical protein